MTGWWLSNALVDKEVFWEMANVLKLTKQTKPTNCTSFYSNPHGMHRGWCRWLTNNEKGGEEGGVKKTKENEIEERKKTKQNTLLYKC